MKIRHNMAYRAPAAPTYFGMTASQLREAAASGDAGAQAELDRREANRADPTTKQGQRAARQAQSRQAKTQQAAGGAKDPVERAAEEGKVDDRHHAAAMGAAAAKPSRHPKSPYKGGKIHVSKEVKAHLTAKARATGRDPQEVIEEYRRGALEPDSNVPMVYLYNRGKAKRNPLPYPGATVLYPHQGIIQGGTGPFYGPTGTLFTKMPDLMWEYKNNPRMQGVDILWPKTVAEAGPIQGGAARYMSYPSAAPFDRMPNLTRTLKNKRSR
jgi:hypothetical protein